MASGIRGHVLESVTEGNGTQQLEKLMHTVQRSVSTLSEKSTLSHLTKLVLCLSQNYTQFYKDNRITHLEKLQQQKYPNEKNQKSGKNSPDWKKWAEHQGHGRQQKIQRRVARDMSVDGEKFASCNNQAGKPNAKTRLSVRPCTKSPTLAEPLRRMTRSSPGRTPAMSSPEQPKNIRRNLVGLEHKILKTKCRSGERSQRGSSRSGSVSMSRPLRPHFLRNPFKKRQKLYGSSKKPVRVTRSSNAKEYSINAPRKSSRQTKMKTFGSDVIMTDELSTLTRMHNIVQQEEDISHLLGDESDVEKSSASRGDSKKRESFDTSNRGKKSPYAKEQLDETLGTVKRQLFSSSKNRKSVSCEIEDDVKPGTSAELSTKRRNQDTHPSNSTKLKDKGSFTLGNPSIVLVKLENKAEKSPVVTRKKRGRPRKNKKSIEPARPQKHREQPWSPEALCTSTAIGELTSGLDSSPEEQQQTEEHAAIFGNGGDLWTSVTEPEVLTMDNSENGWNDVAAEMPKKGEEANDTKEFVGQTLTFFAVPNGGPSVSESGQGGDSPRTSEAKVISVFKDHNYMYNPILKLPKLHSKQLLSNFCDVQVVPRIKQDKIYNANGCVVKEQNGTDIELMSSVDMKIQANGTDMKFNENGSDLKSNVTDLPRLVGQSNTQSRKPQSSRSISNESMEDIFDWKSTPCGNSVTTVEIHPCPSGDMSDVVCWTHSVADRVTQDDCKPHKITPTRSRKTVSQKFCNAEKAKLQRAPILTYEPETTDSDSTETYGEFEELERVVSEELHFSHTVSKLNEEVVPQSFHKNSNTSAGRETESIYYKPGPARTKKRPLVCSQRMEEEIQLRKMPRVEVKDIRGLLDLSKEIEDFLHYDKPEAQFLDLPLTQRNQVVELSQRCRLAVVWDHEEIRIFKTEESRLPEALDLDYLARLYY